MLDKGSPTSVNVTLRGLRANATVLVETLDQSHGNAIAAWQRMGSPEPPTREQAAQLRQAAAATLRETFHADASGTFKFQRNIEPWSVVLIQQQ